MGSPANENFSDKTVKNGESHDVAKRMAEGPSALQQAASELLSKATDKAAHAAMYVLDAIVDRVAPVKSRDIALANMAVMKPAGEAEIKQMQIEIEAQARAKVENSKVFIDNREVSSQPTFQSLLAAPVERPKADATDTGKTKPAISFLPNLEIDGLAPSQARKAPVLKLAN